MTGIRWMSGAAIAALIMGSVVNAHAQDTPPADAGAAPAAASDEAAPAKPMKKKAKAAASSDFAGTAIQVGHAKGYTVILKFTGNKAETSYPDLACNGKLTRVGAKGDTSFYLETITAGALDAATGKGCIDGTVTLIKSGDGYIWGWIGQHDGKPIVAYATLAKQAMAQ